MPNSEPTSHVSIHITGKLDYSDVICPTNQEHTQSLNMCGFRWRMGCLAGLLITTSSKYTPCECFHSVSSDDSANTQQTWLEELSRIEGDCFILKGAPDSHCCTIDD